MPTRREGWTWRAPALALLAVVLCGVWRLDGFASLLLYGDEGVTIWLSRQGG